ncbi:MAG TPA: hypothetical protein VFK41_01245 [Nocardioidaceae bacterium]|nr:hypothetical protein [Nocardioidaceae bacterium]
MNDRLSKAEIGKDAVEGTLDAAAETVAKVTSIVTHAVRDVARALGEFGTELFEIRDAARKASDKD